MSRPFNRYIGKLTGSEDEVGWIYIGIGILLVLSGNIRGAYHKDIMPKPFLRIVFTLAGIGLVVVGIHYLGVRRL